MSASCPLLRDAWPFLLQTLAMVALSTGLAGCGAKPAPPAPAPTEVGIVTVMPARMALTTELPGRLEATRIAQVRARVPGIVLKRVFEEGSDVKAGQILFRIDSAPLQATFASSEASVAKSDANLAQANLKVKRYRPLVDLNAISRQEYDDALTAQQQAVADLSASRASRQSASLNLAYATVTAPISGRIGRAQVTEGALVGQGEATALAIVQQIDPIYVNFTQSSTDVLRMRRAMASGKLQAAGSNAGKVTLVLEDGTTFAQTGKLLFSDVNVDESSGAITLRAAFPNPGHLLLPGMYVRARLEQAVNDAALALPQQAIQRTSDGESVFVVGADNKVAIRAIQTGSMQGALWIISTGLQAGDRVIVEGMQKIKAGATVRTVNWHAPEVPGVPDTQLPVPAGASRQSGRP